MKEIYCMDHGKHFHSIVIAIQTIVIIDNATYAYLKNLHSCCKLCLSACHLFSQLPRFPALFAASPLLFTFFF